MTVEAEKIALLSADSIERQIERHISSSMTYLSYSLLRIGPKDN
jgi:hypothetical protein